VSIPVALEELGATLASYPWGFFVTVGDDLRGHSLAAPTDFREGVLHLSVGRSTRANLAARPDVTMVFPHPSAGEFSLILDGVAAAAAVGDGDGDVVVFTPSYAVLHRPAIPT
jgi:hypothetical protein